MAENSKIEWTDATWNPVTGCTKVSPGCAHCYAERMSKRLAGRCGYPKDDQFRVTLHENRLSEPLHWRKPRMIFVCSMGDLFHEDVPTEYIAECFGVMHTASQHTFQVLTKRPERMLDYRRLLPWPENVWAGVTCENQAMAELRIPELLKVPAAVRFVSIEPMLGPIDLAEWLGCDCITSDRPGWDNYEHTVLCQACEGSPYRDRIDWVIVGGETGPGARPMHPDWVRSIRDQCQSAGTSFFFKQWGEWSPESHYDPYLHKPPCHAGAWLPDGRFVDVETHDFDAEAPVDLEEAQWMYRVGKKKAGRELDGRVWDEMPQLKET